MFGPTSGYDQRGRPLLPRQRHLRQARSLIAYRLVFFGKFYPALPIHYSVQTVDQSCRVVARVCNGGITTTIKHAITLTIKLKTSPARLVVQLLQPSLAFCCKLQPMTAYRQHAVIGCNLQQNAHEGCNSCASLAGPELVLSFIVSFIACFIVVVIPP